MRPVLTKKAREAKPQYLDQYIKQKLSLESIPETASTGNLIRKGSLKKGTLLTVGGNGSKKNFIKKYTANEKSVQDKLLGQMRSALHPHGSEADGGALSSRALSPTSSNYHHKVVQSNSGFFNRALLNDFLQTKFITEQQQ